MELALTVRADVSVQKLASCSTSNCGRIGFGLSAHGSKVASHSFEASIKQASVLTSAHDSRAQLFMRSQPGQRQWCPRQTSSAACRCRTWSHQRQKSRSASAPHVSRSAGKALLSTLLSPAQLHICTTRVGLHESKTFNTKPQSGKDAYTEWVPCQGLWIAMQSATRASSAA